MSTLLSVMKSVPPAVAGGFCDVCQSSISDLPLLSATNSQSAVHDGNQDTPATAGGTDFMSLRRANASEHSKAQQLLCWRSRRLNRHCRNILIAHQLIKRRHLGLHDLGQPRQLRINLHDHLIVDGVRLFGWRCISAG